MFYAKSLHSYHAICEVLDEAVEPSLRPLVWRKPLYTAIDELYATAAPEDMITVAERISIAFLKLDWAILRGEAAKAAAARQQLAELSEAWCALDEAEPLDLNEFVQVEEAAAEAPAQPELAPVHVRIGPNAGRPMFAAPEPAPEPASAPVPETIDDLPHGLDALRNRPASLFGADAEEDDFDTAFDREDVESMTAALERITRGSPLHAC